MGWFVRLVVVAFLPTLVLVGCGEEEVAEKSYVRPVKAMKVRDVARFHQRSFPGRAKATQEVDLAFRVAGPLITLPVDIGSEVKAGDVVARIDPRDFEVNLRNVQGQQDQAGATLKRAQADYDRLQRVFKEDPGATSERAIDRAREQRDSARASIKSLQASVAAANDQLSYTHLKAPFDGTVVAKYVENFEDVRAKQAIVRVVDSSRIEMVVNIPENLISLVPEVEKIVVAFDAFPDLQIPAEIKEIGTEASATTRTYPVTLIMDQPDNATILSGMAGKASGEPPEARRAADASVEIPVAATFSASESDKSYVWIIDEQAKTVTKREVTTGDLTDHGIRVTEGLQPGEWIATAGVHYLREGQQVSILEQ
jgi:RND family efflux transporter MFP subunit